MKSDYHERNEVKSVIGHHLPKQFVLDYTEANQEIPET